MDKEKLKQQLESANKALASSLAANATTDEQRAAQDKAIKEAQEALIALEQQIAASEQLKDKMPTGAGAGQITDAERAQVKKDFADMRTVVENQRNKIAKTKTQLETYRQVEKGQKAGQNTADDFKKAGEATAEFTKDLVQSFGDATKSFVNYFNDEDKTPEQRKAEQDKKEKDQENPDKKGWLDKMGGKGLIGGIIGALLAFMVGKAFGGGIIGKLASFALAFAGFFMGRNFAEKKFGGGSGYKNTAANTTSQTNDPAQSTSATPDQQQTTTSYVAPVDPEIEAKIAAAYQKGLSTPSNDNGVKDVKADQNFSPTSVQYDKSATQQARQ